MQPPDGIVRGQLADDDVGGLLQVTAGMGHMDRDDGHNRLRVGHTPPTSLGQPVKQRSEPLGPQHVRGYFHQMGRSKVDMPRTGAWRTRPVYMAAAHSMTSFAPAPSSKNAPARQQPSFFPYHSKARQEAPTPPTKRLSSPPFAHPARS